MNKLAIVLLFVAVGIMAFRFMNNSNSHKNSNSMKVLTLTTDNFQSETKSRITVVDFWASWCMPCRMMGPIIEKFAENADESVRVGKVNVDENPTIAQEFAVRSIPTIIFFKDGKEAARCVGLTSKETLQKTVESLK